MEGALLTPACTLHGQSATYTASVQNQTVLSDGVFQFDVYVVRTGLTSWRIADATFQLTFNSSAFTGLGISFVSGSTDLSAGYTISPDITTTRINIDIQSPTTFSGSTEISNSGSGTRIGTFKVSTISNSSASMNMAWRTPLLTYQAVNERRSDDSQNLITSNGTYTNPPNAPLGGSSPPSPPTLISPANGATGVSANPTLRWNVSSGATSYRVQVSTDPSFATTVVNQGGVTDTSLALGGLANSTAYYWRVNASNGAGTSDYSTVFSFTTTAGISPPAASTLVSPSNGATNVPLNTSLRWNAVTGATSYNVQVSEDSTFATFTVNRTGVLDTTASTLPLFNNTKYYWRVSASNSAGPGSYSVVRSFTTIVSAPAAPTPVYPPDGALGVRIDTTLTWNPSSGATSYRLQVSTNSNFTALIVDDPTLTTTSKRIGPLNYNSQYFWRVSASNAGGTSAYSTVRSFTTILAAPTLASPSDGTTGVPTNPTLSWNASSGATSYQLQVRVPSLGASTIVDTSGLVATSFSLSGLATSTTYSWRVRATNAGGTSDWSSVRTFTTIPLAPAAPTLDSPTTGATGVSINPTLSWNASSGAASYRLQVSTSSNFATTVVDSTLTITFAQVGPLTTSTQYFWRVSASNAGGTSTFSAVRTFITTVSSVERDEGVIPRSFNLYPNYPNPFNPSTTITYDLPVQSLVVLKIYNAIMQEVATLVDEEQGAGRYRVKFDVAGLASGIYFYRLTAGTFSSVKKMILLR